MKILSINQNLKYENLDIHSIQEQELISLVDIALYTYIIVNGGDGTIRRVVKILDTMECQAKLILNPTGSFNVIAKLHNVPKIEKVLSDLSQNKMLKTNIQKYYYLNKEVFLFSAGNMGDLQHIFVAESLRFGMLKKGIAKYILSGLFLLPLHLCLTPFMLLSSNRFFIFTPLSFIDKFGSFYGKVASKIEINLENPYNIIELDGDIITIKESFLCITVAGELQIVVKH